VDKRVSVLSGGEKARLALAKMLARPANVLLLDEPTNHLDLQSREVLESALAHFAGTIAFISHDRYFINAVATKVVEVRRETPEAPSLVVPYLGDYDYWQWKRAHELAEAAAPPAPPRPAEAAPASARPAPRAGGERQRRKSEQRETDRRKRQAESLERDIDAAETRMKEIDALLVDVEVYRDGPRCKALLDERAALEGRLAGLIDRWEKAAAG
jgi:ATP-binding cassette subfamily F protein 3